MALRRCLRHCGALIRSGSYCAACRPRNGSTRDWRRLRAQILALDGYRCKKCGDPAVEVDHIRPVADGGTDYPSNLRSLCHNCHARALKYRGC